MRTTTHHPDGRHPRRPSTTSHSDTAGRCRHPSLSAIAIAESAVAALVALVALGPAAAAAVPSPSSSAGGGGTADGGVKVGPPTPGVAGCAMPSELDALTGIVATQKGILAIKGGCGRGRNRGRDETGYGVRGPAYSGGYDDHGGYGDQYGDNSYGGGGYTANGYGGD